MKWHTSTQQGAGSINGVGWWWRCYIKLYFITFAVGTLTEMPFPRYISWQEESWVEIRATNRTHRLLIILMIERNSRIWGNNRKMYHFIISNPLTCIDKWCSFAPYDKSAETCSQAFFGTFSVTVTNSNWWNLEFFKKKSLSLFKRMENFSPKFPKKNEFLLGKLLTFWMICLSFSKICLSFFSA